MTSNQRGLKTRFLQCTVCPGECKSYAYYPGCDPQNPGVPFSPPVLSDFVTNDFFGQFSEKTVKKLLPYQISFYTRYWKLGCPDCNRTMDQNPTSDDYLICSWCNIHWDLNLSRPVVLTPPTHKIVSSLKIDGTLSRRKVYLSDSLQLNLDDVPF